MREMKDSGIQWAGLIPNDWSKVRLRDYYVIEKGKNAQKYTVEYIGKNEGNIPVYSGQTDNDGVMGYVNDCDYDVESCLFSTTVGAKAMSPKLLRGKFCLSQNCLIMKSIKEIDNSFMFYELNPLFDFERHSIPQYMQPSLRIDDLNKFIVLLPSLEEQHRISAYLDAKCSEIDALTADIQSQIDTLEQYKRSVITEAVTKGLNRDVEMKESGIEYVGKIPASWDMHPVYYYFGERKHKNSLGEEQNLLSLSYGNIIRKDINTREGLLPESFNTYNIVEAGDIIIRPTDLQNDKRSLRTGLVREHGIITSAYIDLMPVRNINTEYYHYLLHAFDVMKVFYNMGNGVRQGLNFSEFSRLMVFEPSLAEQNSIVDYLNDKCEQINTVISEKQDQLATLDAYKKSTIYEYVTGKKEVPAV